MLNWEMSRLDITGLQNSTKPRGKYFQLGSFRWNKVDDLESWDMQQYEVSQKAIPKRFRGNSSESRRTGNEHCVWISACMLVDCNNRLEATRILELLKTELCKGKLKRLQLFKGSRCRREKKCGKETLSHLLQQYAIGYQLKHVDHKNIPILEYLMSPSVTGKYVCILRTMQLTTNHDVGVNCDFLPKEIWDFCEPRTLELSYDNLNRCVGEVKLFEIIRYVGELKPIPGYRQKRKYPI